MKKYIFLAVCILSIDISSFSQNIRSGHFTIHKLAEGVYSAIANNGGYAICNAGIIDLGNSTLIFDPFMVPEAAKDLKRVAEELTGHEVKYVVNSHFHNDHIGGNQVFINASIISTVRTRELIAQYQPEEIATGKTNAPAQLQKYKEEKVDGMNPHELEEHNLWLGYYEALAKYSDSLKLVLPDITFVDTMELNGLKRKVQLITYGEGHTESDLFLYLPEEKIAFTGDLIFKHYQPWIGDGDMDKWVSYLNRISKMKINTVIPGHGPLGDLHDIDSMKLYFAVIKNTAQAYHSKNILPENDTNLKSTAPFDQWFLNNFYKPNVIAEYRKAK